MAETPLLPSASRIFVAGHRGLVGSAIVRRLEETGCRNLLLRTRAELDLCDQAAVSRFFTEHQTQFVFLAAAKVGGHHGEPHAELSLVWTRFETHKVLLGVRDLGKTAW